MLASIFYLVVSSTSSGQMNGLGGVIGAKLFMEATNGMSCSGGRVRRKDGQFCGETPVVHFENGFNHVGNVLGLQL